MIKTRSLFLLASGCILLAGLAIVILSIQAASIAQDTSNFFLQMS